MLTGFVQVGTSSYFLTSSGAMATAGHLLIILGTTPHQAEQFNEGGWIKSGSAWYYLDEVSGAMRTGEYTVGDTRYYSYDSGGDGIFVLDQLERRYVMGEFVWSTERAVAYFI